MRRSRWWRRAGMRPLLERVEVADRLFDSASRKKRSRPGSYFREVARWMA